MKCIRQYTIGLLFVSWVSSVGGPAHAATPCVMDSRLELFVDEFLIERLDGAQLRLHHPVEEEDVLHFDQPWEGAFCGYITVLHDGTKYRMYYRGLPEAGKDNTEREVTCYAESADGLVWTKPDLQLYEVEGIRNNNVVLHGHAPASHNFSPFLDRRPGVAADTRFKALAGSERSGLMAFASEDGIRWRKLRDEPILTQGQFDSQNVAFWSESESCYVCYFRTWTGDGYSGFRTVSRSTSSDFLHWSKPVQMSFGETPLEHLYTNQTLPYYRAPHVYIALPMRFVPDRQVLTPDQAEQLGVHADYAGSSADVVLMSSRGGNRFDRTFMEAFIRPGTDLGNWASRAGMTAYGIVQTRPEELSIYKQAHYAQPDAHLVRYTLRTDGFTSVFAPYAGGELLTRPLRFEGSELVINFATSAVGSVQVEIQDSEGQPLTGYTLEEADELIGDNIERVVRWKSGSSVGSLSGQAVRLRFAMKDADLYSLRFR